MIKGTGNRKRKCKCCGADKRAHEGFIAGVNFVCNQDCAYKLTLTALESSRKREAIKAKQSQAKKEKAARESRRERNKEVKSDKYWQDKLQKLVNQYVMKVLRKGERCVSCGNQEPTEAGHFLSRGAHPNKRFLLNNIFPQCHECNVYKSGNAGEYEKTLVARFGDEFVCDLKSYNTLLKEQFPHWTDYEKEIKRYRKILRDNGVTPCQ